MRLDYWTCSKFADWLRGTPKPGAGTIEEWNAWEKAAKQKKFRYWLAEEGLDRLQTIVYWPFNQIKSLLYYVNNRWIRKSHALTSHLERGYWHEFDTRLLHAVFDELVNFVEIELAGSYVVLSEEASKKYKTPWYGTFLRISSWRSPEAGVAYLKWESELKADEEWMAKSDPTYGQPTPQALAAQEIFALYQWWKEERPNRPDPREVSGWDSYCDKNTADDQDGELFASLAANSEKDDPVRNSLLVKYRQLEQAQEEEDTAMLIRLIKIRRRIWT